MMAHRNRIQSFFLCACIALALISTTFVASAHISLEQGGTHKSRYGDAEIKDGPCGRSGGARGTNIYTYAPGQKITVTVVETIPHPSYFRFAFDNDGDDAFIEPASILPIDPARKCPDGAGDHCGTSDFYNSPAVLPNMDNLNPHISASAGTKYTWEVTLPNVTCTNCTLQLIQVMEDDLAHGPYDPTPGVGVEDIYHQCIDLVLTGDAGTGGSNDAGRAGDANADSSSPRDSGGSTGADASKPPTSDAAGGTGGSGGATGSGGSGTTTGSGGTTGGSGTTGSGGSGATGGGTTGGSGTTGSGGSGATGGGGATGGSTPGGRAGSGGSSGAAAGTAGANGGDPGNTGCGCSVLGARGSSRAIVGVSLLALALASRRRRR